MLLNSSLPSSNSRRKRFIPQRYVGEGNNEEEEGTESQVHEGLNLASLEEEQQLKQHQMGNIAEPIIQQQQMGNAAEPIVQQQQQQQQMQFADLQQHMDLQQFMLAAAATYQSNSLHSLYLIQLANAMEAANQQRNSALNGLQPNIIAAVALTHPKSNGHQQLHNNNVFTHQAQQSRSPSSPTPSSTLQQQLMESIFGGGNTVDIANKLQMHQSSSGVPNIGSSHHLNSIFTSSSSTLIKEEPSRKKRFRVSNTVKHLHQRHNGNASGLERK